MKRRVSSSHRLFPIFLFLLICLLSIKSLRAQDYVTGAFEGKVTDAVTGAPVPGATVQIINKDTGVPVARQTDSNGNFRQGLLPPGDYTIRVSKQGYITCEAQQSLPAVRPTSVTPVPVKLNPESAAAAPTPTPAPGPMPAPAPPQQPAGPGILAEINTTDAQRGGTYTDKDVSTLPLGATTLTRTFDELGLLLPGVALPPQTQGSVAGPGVGAGVGSAGQFAVNGLRSRANNFTVDGSDNNDEDIGVRRQGFLALVPQPIESIKEFQMITLLAPAQYGRNLGAQVNAISKSGGNSTHGAFYGLFNSSQLNSREFFDTTNGNASIPLVAGNNQPVLDCGPTPLQSNPTCRDHPATYQIRVKNQSGGKDSFTLGQGGLVLGGPLVPETPSRPGRSIFYFFSVEGHALNATKEQSFAVPTVEQRGFGNTGATGVAAIPLPDICDPQKSTLPCSQVVFFPTTTQGDAVFSLFPFANNPNGVYGANTLTQVLPASGQSKILSGKIDSNFKMWQRQQSLTARYSFTQDWRDIPATGGAIFSALRPRVRTQNFSMFLNSELSSPNSAKGVFNQLRLSYGRTRLNFQPVPDKSGFLLPSSLSSVDSVAGFLLNARAIKNFTGAMSLGVPNTRPVIYGAPNLEPDTESLLGPVGQVNIAGFSPVGVDVYNFPQKRVNNTYQVADTLTIHMGAHSVAFGTDIRRTELNSDLAPNARPLLTFAGAPYFGPAIPAITQIQIGEFISGVSLAAAGAPSSFRQNLTTGSSSDIHLRYYQLDFFGQDEWRVRPNLSLSYGLRYEYNTPPRELNRRIEETFTSSDLSLVPGLPQFGAGRTSIFDPDKNNFGPRVGLAYSFGHDRTSTIRAGYGIFFDQILGAVVSQSRNVFPTFITVDYAGGGFGTIFGDLRVVNPTVFFVQPGTLNGANIAGFGPTLAIFVRRINNHSTGSPNLSAISPTLPARELKTPMAHQYAVTFEQQLGRGTVLSAAYVGTLGRDLLRFTTPNLGPNGFIVPTATDSSTAGMDLSGYALPPGSRVTNVNSTTGTITFSGGRPLSGVGAISIFQTTAKSRYDALQVQLRGRLKFIGSTHYQVGYTFSRSNDDASDVFDLAGSSALAQNSLAPAGEYAPSNFDARHRIAYSYVTDPPHFKSRAAQAILGNVQISGTGQFQTGQPFTVNSIFDVNLDGNLTDRLNTTSGIVQTGDRSQPFRLTVNPLTLLAPVGENGAVPRNSFRASNLWLTNTAVTKTFHLSEQVKLVFRTEVFNLFNRANFGIPVRFLEAPGFGKATDTVTPGRRIQFGLKLVF
jgi:hypothetical protein